MKRIKLLSVVIAMLLAVSLFASEASAISFYAGADAGLALIGYGDAKSNKRATKSIKEFWDPNTSAFTGGANFGVIIPKTGFSIGAEYSINYFGISGEKNEDIRIGETIVYGTDGTVINNTISFVGYLHIDKKIELLGSIGAGFYSVTSEFTSTLKGPFVEEHGVHWADTGTTVRKDSIDESGLSIKIGLGAIYNLTNHWGIKIAGYYNNYTGAKFITNSIDILGGIRYSF